MSSRRRSKGGHTVDRQLIPRVAAFLDERQGPQQTVDADDIVEHLQRTFPMYKRKPRGTLRISVEKALYQIEKGAQDLSAAEDKLETEYTNAKKRDKDMFDDSSDSQSDFQDNIPNNSGTSSGEGNFEDNDGVMLLETTNNQSKSQTKIEYNSLNNALRDTYKNARASMEIFSPQLQTQNAELTQQSEMNEHQQKQKLQHSISIQQKPKNNNYPKSPPRNNQVSSRDKNNTNSTSEQWNSGVGSPPRKKQRTNNNNNPDRQIENAILKPRGAMMMGGFSNGSGNSGSSNIITRPSARFSDVGGLDNILQTIRELVERPMIHPELYAHLGVQPPRGILLHGPPGCGKTMLAHAIAGELGVPFLKVSAPEIVSGVSGESESKIRAIFEEAIRSAPSIIFMDEIDAITPKRQDASRDMERRIVAQLLTCMDELTLEKTGGKAVIILGATNRPDALDGALRRAGRFDREICLGVPTEKARAQILKILSQSMKLEGNFDFVQIARKTPGFVGADLSALTKEAANIAINRIFSVLENKITTNEPLIQPASINVNLETKKVSEGIGEIRSSVNNQLSSAQPFTSEQLSPLSITMHDFEQAIPHVQPSATREGFATIPDVTWSSIGALHDIRKALEMALLAPINHREKYEKIGLAATSAGVLLYGPPGCGKTLLAKAMANECQLNFISIKGPELLNKYVGESERAVRQVFSRARASSPCIIFFDEMDALCPRRESSGDSNRASQRVVNQMLTEMDGLDSRKEIFIIAASNRPDMIDPAILRPGRIDKLLYIPIPDAKSRVEILKTCTRKTPLAADVDVEKLATSEKCSGFSGADIDLLVRQAQEECLRLAVEQSEPLVVTNKHFSAALTKIMPSVTKQDEIRYNKLNKHFISSRIRETDTAEDKTQ